MIREKPLPRKSSAGTGNRHLIEEEKTKKEIKMLTIKYISPEGEELVTEALRVISKPNPVKAKQPIEVTWVEPDGHSETYNSGTVFVMNEAGSTVSRWLILP